MKKVICIISCVFLLIFAGCSKKEEAKITKEKKSFFIEGKYFDSFDAKTELIKSGKMESSQNIAVSSQAQGRVGNIYFKEGDFVNKGELIIALEDNIHSYGLALKQALNNKKKAEISYVNTKNSLEKQISDLKINRDNLSIDSNGSKSSLELEKIENSLAKLALDYENLVYSNKQTIKGFSHSLTQYYNTFQLFLNDVRDFADKELGVTQKNESYNDAYQYYLGVQNTAQLSATQKSLSDIIIWQSESLGSFDGSNIEGAIEILNTGYAKINVLLSGLEEVFDNTIPSAGYLSSSELATKIASVNTYQATYNINTASLVALTNSIESFLDSYEGNEISLKKQIELLESDKKIYTTTLDVNIELQDDTLDQAVNNKDLTLSNAQILIEDADIAYTQALRSYNKLFIKAPISGFISQISVDVGQEIGMQTPVFTIVNHADNEVTISFTQNELRFVEEGDPVFIRVGENTHTGSIYSISKFADMNLNYQALLHFEDNFEFLGDIVSVTIPIEGEDVLIPIKIVEIKTDDIGSISLYKSGAIEKRNVILGKVYGSMIEVSADTLDSSDYIITTYLGNYDPDTFDLQLK